MSNLNPFCVLMITLLLTAGCGEEKTSTLDLDTSEDELILISHETLNFGGAKELLTFRLTNNSHQPVRWTASTDAPWLTISPLDGGIDPWSERKITVTVNRARLQNWEEIGVIRIDIPEYDEREETWVSIYNPRFHPSDEVLKRMFAAMQQKDLDAYLDVFWEEGYHFESTRGTPNRFDDRIIESLALEKSRVNAFFGHYNNIRMNLTSVPEIDQLSRQAIVTAQYRIRALQTSENKEYESGGALIFTFEKRDGEWRIRAWKASPSEPTPLFYKEL